MAPEFDNTTSQVLPGFHIHRLSIRPYPAELEHVVRLSDGTPIRLPPNRPEVEAVQQRAFGLLSPETIRSGRTRQDTNFHMKGIARARDTP